MLRAARICALEAEFQRLVPREEPIVLRINHQEHARRVFLEALGLSDCLGDHGGAKIATLMPPGQTHASEKPSPDLGVWHVQLIRLKNFRGDPDAPGREREGSHYPFIASLRRQVFDDPHRSKALFLFVQRAAVKIRVDLLRAIAIATGE